MSAGGIGFDISCGVRTLHAGLTVADVEPLKQWLADRLFARIPVGVSGTGELRLNAREMDAMLKGGARWAVERGSGSAAAWLAPGRARFSSRLSVASATKSVCLDRATSRAEF